MELPNTHASEDGPLPHPLPPMTSRTFSLVKKQKVACKKKPAAECLAAPVSPVQQEGQAGQPIKEEYDEGAYLDEDALRMGNSEAEGEAELYYKLQKLAGGPMAIVMVRDGDCRAHVLQLSPKGAQGKDARTVLGKTVAKLEKEDFTMTALLKNSDNLMRATTREKAAGQAFEEGVRP